MKRTPLFLLLLAVLLVAIACPAQADPKPRIAVGDSVAAQWSDGNYYVGTVTAINGAKFKILYEDGDRKTVDAAQVFELRDDRPFAVGDRVLAAWKGAQMFPGVIVAVNTVTCRVKWDDGDAPMEVKKSRMIRRGKK